MPKSRKRRKPNHSRAHGRTSTGRPRATEDPQSARFRELMEAMAAVDQAEVRGDVYAALRIIRETRLAPSEQPFWKPERIRRLTQIAELGVLLPGWARSRWILEQALQLLDASSRDRIGLALETATDARGGLDALPGVDVVDARGRVMDHDWLYRQMFLYDLGGLQHFLDSTASAELVAAADGIGDWAKSEMRGYRLLRQTPHAITWEDLASRAVVDVLNIGAASLVDDGECVIGRVVPIRDGLMFETAPLHVPETVAIAVAADPQNWSTTVLAACRTHGVSAGSGIVLSGPFDYGVVTDVPRMLWQIMANPSEDTDPVDGAEDDSVTLALRLLTLALGARLLADAEEELDLARLWPAAGAALMEPGVAHRLDSLVAPSLAEHWRWLARVLPEPADELAHELAQASWGAA